MEMNRDEFIKRKFKEDTVISDRANNVFKNFEKQIYDESIKNNPINNVSNLNNTINTDFHTNMNKVQKNNIENMSNNYNNKDNVSDFMFYKKLNKILSVAAVFLCAIVIGAGTFLYNRKPNIESINITTKSVTVKNEELKFENEQVLKESENEYVKASLIGKKDVAIQLKDKFIKSYGVNLSSNKQYKVNNITKNVSDIFVGSIISEDRPYVMLVMEDGTAESIQILDDNFSISNNYEFYFCSQGKISGLSDVAGFEQKTRNFSYSNSKYYYINAIRKDGKRKEVELGYYNDWDDETKILFNSLNEANISRHQEEENTKKYGKDYYKYTESDYEYNNITVLNQKNGFAYYKDNDNFYRINKSTGEETLLASGVSGTVRDNSDGRITVLLKQSYKIYETDNEIIYNEFGVDRLKRVVSSRSVDGINIELRENGSLTLLFELGQFERMNIKSDETKLHENVRYNIYGLGEDVYDKDLRNSYAHAKVFAIGNVGPENVLSIVYAKFDDTVVCMDIVQMIKSSDIHLTKKVIKDASNVESFKEEAVYKEENGEKVLDYNTIFTIERRENVTFYNREINYND